jgi:seryl-tRNA(Sec) selenium transferase
MQNPNELLAATVAAFERWRTNRTSATQTTPPALQQQAVALLDNFSSSKIVIALNISGTNLKRWAGQLSPANGQLVATEFITLPREDNPPTAELNLELTFGNGCHMRLCGDISPAQLSAITVSVTAHARELP